MTAEWWINPNLETELANVTRRIEVKEHDGVVGFWFDDETPSSAVRDAELRGIIALKDRELVELRRLVGMYRDAQKTSGEALESVEQYLKALGEFLRRRMEMLETERKCLEERGTIGRSTLPREEREIRRARVNGRIREMETISARLLVLPPKER
jgi:hypothetical protein